MSCKFLGLFPFPFSCAQIPRRTLGTWKNLLGRCADSWARALRNVWWDRLHRHRAPGTRYRPSRRGRLSNGRCTGRTSGAASRTRYCCPSDICFWPDARSRRVNNVPADRCSYNSRPSIAPFVRKCRLIHRRPVLTYVRVPSQKESVYK